MKHSNSRIGIIVLFASLLMMFNAYPVFCQEELVKINILNATTDVIPVCHGDIIAVEYEVFDTGVVGIDDRLQLRLGDENGDVVLEFETQGAQTGRADMDTQAIPETLLGPMSIVYTSGQGLVVAKAYQVVSVVSETTCYLIAFATDLHKEATNDIQQQMIEEYIQVLCNLPDIKKNKSLYNNTAWHLFSLTVETIDKEQKESINNMVKELKHLSENGFPVTTAAAEAFFPFYGGKCTAFVTALNTLNEIMLPVRQQLSGNEMDDLLESVTRVVGCISHVVQGDAGRLRELLEDLLETDDGGGIKPHKPGDFPSPPQSQQNRLNQWVTKSG